MKKIYEIKDQELIDDTLNNAEFGTLAICSNNKPYCVPLNFVLIEGEIYIHGKKKGKKIDIINKNSLASFSIVESYSVLPSYFSTDDGRASPATHMYKSIILDGHIEFIKDYNIKVNALGHLMQKYQKEGGYIPLSDAIYKKIIDATCIYKLIPKQVSAKFHFAQAWDEKRFNRVCKHLKQRGTKKDLQTIKLLEKFRKNH